tara:strand:+ start:431 stop:1399 length:969 start_codon:yes stop_codon:yes gene_type:complete
MNIVHNIDFLNNDLPDKCAKLIIADPPYYKVKGDFDFIWKTFEDYLLDVKKWCLECKRILADNGTLFWYGDAKNIAYAQIIFDKHFNLINNLTWNKGSFMGLEESEGLRSFAPCTERILMYSKNNDIIENRDLSNSGHLVYMKPTIDYLRFEREKSTFSVNELSKKLNLGKHQLPHYFTYSGFRFPKEKVYNDLKKITGCFNKNYNDLLKEYEKDKNKYEDLRRPFNNLFNLQEVLNFSNEAVKTGNNYDHDTVKPETLTRALILTCSRKNDLVVVPFAGSGTECAMSAKEKRPFMGYEITEKHAKMSQERANKILKEPTLF